MTTVDQVGRAFSAMPYENLTKIIKAGTVVTPRSAMRLPDEVISDHLQWGCGGTCFSLAAAMIAIFDALGIEAHPILADRHYGTDTHCGLVVMHNRSTLLLDPGYLLFIPTPLPERTTVSVALGYTTIELQPSDDGSRIDLVTVVSGSRKTRLTYKRSPVDPETFERAWVASFAWEMMTYPVLNRCAAGEHIYLQGSTLAVRSALGTTRTRLGLKEQAAFIGDSMGISREIVVNAWRAMNHATA